MLIENNAVYNPIWTWGIFLWASENAKIHVLITEILVITEITAKCLLETILNRSINFIMDSFHFENRKGRQVVPFASVVIREDPNIEILTMFIHYFKPNLSTT